MSIAALVTITKRKQPKMDGWMDKRWNIHTMESHSALKRKEILTQATTWVKPENIMLREISQSLNKYCVIPLI